MPSRYQTYQFDWGFATYDSQTESDAISQVEQEAKYITKFDVNMNEADMIEKGATIEVTEGGVNVYQEAEVL